MPSKLLPRKEGRYLLTLPERESLPASWARQANIAVNILLSDPISNKVSLVIGCRSCREETPWLRKQRAPPVVTAAAIPGMPYAPHQWPDLIVDDASDPEMGGMRRRRTTYCRRRAEELPPADHAILYQSLSFGRIEWYDDLYSRTGRVSR